MYKRRRTRIKLIAVFFAVVSVAILAALMIFIFGTKKTSSRDSFSNEKSNFFSKVRLKAYGNNIKEVSLLSDDIHEKEKDNYILKNMLSTFTFASGEVLTVSADTTKTVGKDKMRWEFTENVKLSTKSGLTAETAKMFLDIDKKTARGDTAIVITTDSTKLLGEKYLCDMNNNVLTLNHNVEGVHKTGKINADELIIYFDDVNKKNMRRMNAAGNAVYSSDAYTIKAKKLLYENDMIDAQDDVVLFFQKDGNDYEVQAAFMRAYISQGTITYVEANGSLRIKTKDATIHARKGIFKGDKIKVMEDVVVSGKPGSLFGNAATLNIQTGDVSISQSNGIVDDGAHK
ncbi:MAG: LPS export ABC transporter periplasmic protein LptC [Holosporaceae bacterium]|nr:LPS export ABC transporter periplasmic protein LptC [Holosporaceae bacterium]